MAGSELAYGEDCNCEIIPLLSKDTHSIMTNVKISDVGHVLNHAHQFVSVNMAFCQVILLRVIGYWLSFLLHSSNITVCEGYTLIPVVIVIIIHVFFIGALL